MLRDETLKKKKSKEKYATMALEWTAGRPLLKPPRLKLSVGCLCLVVVFFWLISSMLAFGLARRTSVQVRQPPSASEGPGAALTETKSCRFL